MQDLIGWDSCCVLVVVASSKGVVVLLGGCEANVMLVIFVDSEVIFFVLASGQGEGGGFVGF